MSYTTIYDSRRFVRSDSSDTTVLLPVAAGGSGANLSATGGAHEFVKQETVGGAFTVAVLGSGDVPDAALSSNVALLNRTPQTFTGTNKFAAVGVGGSAAPTAVVLLDVADNAATNRFARVSNANAAGNAIFIARSGDGTTSSRVAFLEIFSNETVSQDWIAGMNGSKSFVVRDNTAGNNRLTIDQAAGFVTLTAALIQPQATGAVAVPTGNFIIIGDEWSIASTNEVALVGTAYARVA